MPLSKFILDPNEVIRLQPQELAGYLVQDLKSHRGAFVPYNYISSTTNDYGESFKPSVAESVAEALAWLISAALVIPDYTGSSGHGLILSKRARLLSEPEDINKLAKIRETLPKTFLDPLIAQHAAPIFESGKSDTAVFEAFKQLEILIRDATGLNKLDGVDLVREAFKPANPNNKVLPGPLTDAAARDNEQQGMQQLFAGAMLTFRNPSGHQNLLIDPQEAAELIVFASHLVGIVHKRIGAMALAKASLNNEL